MIKRPIEWPLLAFSTSCPVARLGQHDLDWGPLTQIGTTGRAYLGDLRGEIHGRAATGGSVGPCPQRVLAPAATAFRGASPTGLGTGTGWRFRRSSGVVLTTGNGSESRCRVSLKS